MPIIPAMTLAQPHLDAEEVYDDLWSPATTPDSGEILHGGLNEDNYYGGQPGANQTLAAHQVQQGCFMRGFYQGFERWEFTYARQLDGDGATPGAVPDVASQRVVHAGLSGRFFVPYSTSAILYGYQALFRHDATEWGNNGGAHLFEFWNLQVKIGATVEQCLFHRLPHNRFSAGVPDPASAFYANPGHSDERRWRWVHKQGMLKDQDPGYFQFQVSVWARIMAPDAQEAKLQTPTGGLWMIALR